MLRRKSSILLLFTLTLTAGLWAQNRPDSPPDFDVKEHYTKYEYRIPMRDGVHLFTSVYVPKDSSNSYPFLIDRTPYNVGPYGVDLYRTQLGPSPDFDKTGYIFVFQDVRGRFMSEGPFIEMRPHIDNKKSKQDVDDSSDLYDTIDWLLKNVPNNNGNAGIWGISYPGFFTSASIIDSHPALKAASPQAPMTNLFMGDDAYHGGAFMLRRTSASTASSSRRKIRSLHRKPMCLSTGVPKTLTISICRLDRSRACGNFSRAEALCGTTRSSTIPLTTTGRRAIWRLT